MKGYHLGEFEELVMLLVANLGNRAYGLNIRDELEIQCNRTSTLSAVHTTLHRLEGKGYLESAYHKSDVKERGGRPKLVFKLTQFGISVLDEVRQLRNTLWEGKLKSASW